MKKCPNCGTILDDSKKKCYMCGTSLNNVSSTSFLDNVENEIGAVVSESQDNVFNNGEDIEVLDEVVDENNTQTFYSSTSNSVGLLGADITNLNQSQPINTESTFNNTNTIDTNNTFNQTQVQEQQNPYYGINQTENPYNTQQQIEQPMQQPMQQPINNFQTTQQLPQANFEKQEHVFIPERIPDDKGRKKVKEKKEINWGNNLAKKGKIKIANVELNSSLIFNSLCFLIFIGMLVFVYFKFIKTPSNEDVYLGGLTYTIDKDFKLANNDSSSKYYTYNGCSVRINYGINESGDDAIDKYFEKITNHHDQTQEALTYHRDVIKIGDNSWESLNIDYTINDPNTQNKIKIITKYKYITIIHNANFYSITYSNPNDNETCSLKFDEFLDTLSFE